VSERWRRIDALFHDALSREPAERQAFLVDACAGDESLRAEVESLLAASDADSGVLGHPVGRRIGNYELRGLLGAGGMGEVYRAYDARLGREVALKVLPPEFTMDPERLARFEREARALASINHANIAAIYGVEDLPGDGSRVAALVLELVEGETLAERIARGPLPVAEAIRIAGHLVDALDAAHEKGIVHRDLKPANIKLSPDGIVKVLDFGLAKTMQGVSGAPLAMTMNATSEGLIVGTPAYMSPEQARGEIVDERTDVWAFGCVLFEMLTRVQAFGGATGSDTVAAIIERAPDWSRLPADTPSAVRRLLRWTLEKDRRRRLRDVGDARVDLADALSPDVAPTPLPPRYSVRVFASVGAAVLLATVLGGLLVWRFVASRSEPASVARFAIEMPAGEPLVAGGAALAVSPDGRYVAFSTTHDGRSAVYVRAIDRSDARLVSDAASYPFFSPDSQWIAFFSARRLMKQPVGGGAAVKVADAVAGRGGSWADAGFIVFAGESRSFLSRVSADGGPVTQLTTLDSATETSHRFPAMLPGSRAVIFRVEGTGPDTRIDVYDIETGQRRPLVKEDASDLHYARTGHLLFRVGSNLMGAAFDLSRLQLAGPPALIQPNVQAFDVSGTGLLLYSGEDTSLETLAWVDRKGVPTPLPVPSRNYELPRLSPDGQRLVVQVDERETSNGRGIWTYDLAREQLTRLTFDGWNLWPLWSSDGTRVVYASNRPGTNWDLFVRPADGSGVAMPVMIGPRAQVPRDVSRDDLVVYTSDAGQNGEIWLLSLDGGTPGRKFLSLRSEHAAFSPDARWIAYVSREAGSGREEVYIGRTDGSAGKWQASSAGGTEPRWNRNGRELFYRNGNKLLAVSVSGTTVLSFDPPQTLFENGAFPLSTIGINYDVSADGQRFLMVMQDPRVSRSKPLQVVTGWFAELKARVPN
jgi:eukaryotic-like serine/threonine-protein kinase